MANKNEDSHQSFLSKHSYELFLLAIIVIICSPLNTTFFVCVSSLLALYMITRLVKYRMDQKHEEKMMILQVEKIMKEGPSE